MIIDSNLTTFNPFFVKENSCRMGIEPPTFGCIGGHAINSAIPPSLTQLIIVVIKARITG
jgi:hypothetical protein